MTAKKIGISWSDEKIAMVETDGSVSTVAAIVPLLNTDRNSPFRSDLTEDIQTVALLQKNLREHRFSAVEANLALPIKEFILRSFIIPVVKPNEMASVIEFEARKFVPFDLKDVTYVYHTIPITQNAAKRLRVILYAVKKDVLERYERLLKQANLTCAVIEPSAVSFVKGLLSKSLVKKEQKFCFLHVQEKFGRIIFVDQGVPCFVREFSLSIPSVADEDVDTDFLKAKVYNEVRASFDYFARQFDMQEVGECIIPAGSDLYDIKSLMEQELKCSVREINYSLNVALKVFDEIDLIYAVGAAVNSLTVNVPSLNWLSKKSTVRSGVNKASGIDFKIDLNLYKPVVMFFIVIVILVLGVFLFSRNHLKTYQAQVDVLKTQQAEFVDTPVESIEGMIAINASKLEEFKKIRVTSNLSVLLVDMYRLMPEGMWFSSVNVEYFDYEGKKLNDNQVVADSQAVASIKIDLQGGIFLEDSNRQISAINDYVIQLRKSASLSKYFSHVELISIKKQVREDGLIYTNFEIDCF